jgi:heme O synthase-like polyprenyltransferase
MKDKLIALTLPGGETIDAPEGVIESGSLTGILSWSIIVITWVGVIAALLFLIWGAIGWITSGGNEEKLNKARQTVVYSIIGLVIVLCSVMIMGFVRGVLGLN